MFHRFTTRLTLSNVRIINQRRALQADVSIQGLIHDDALTAICKAHQSAIPMARQRSIIASQTNGTVNHANIITELTHQPIHRRRHLVRLLLADRTFGSNRKSMIGKIRHLSRSHARIHNHPRFTPVFPTSVIPILRIFAWYRTNTTSEKTSRCPLRRTKTYRAYRVGSRFGTRDFRRTRRRLHAVTWPVTCSASRGLPRPKLSCAQAMNSITIYGTTNRCLTYLNRLENRLGTSSPHPRCLVARSGR